MKNENYELLKSQKRDEELKAYYQDDTYTQKYGTLFTISGTFSWIFNLVSGFAAFAFVFWLVNGLAQNALVSAIISAVVIVLWEYLKRNTSSLSFKDYWKDGKFDDKWLLVATFAILASSATVSFFGAKWTTPELKQGPELISFNDEAALLQSQVNELKTTINDYKTNKKYQNQNGEILWKIIHKTIPAKEEELSLKNTELAALQKNIKAENKQTSTLYTTYTQYEAWNYALLCGVVDMLLISALFFREKYKYMEAVERGIILPHGQTPQLDIIANDQNKPTTSTKTNQNETDLHAQIAAYLRHQNKQGNPFQNNPALANETTETPVMKQNSKTTETPVVQAFQPETGAGETTVSNGFETRRKIGFQIPETGNETNAETGNETTVSDHTETTEIYVISSDEKGIRNKALQAFSRLYKQKSKDTPRRVLQETTGALMMNEYFVNYNGQPITPDLIRNMTVKKGDRLRIWKTSINYDYTKTIE